VLLLDPRVRTKGYGRRFLQALPFSPDHDPTG
jgi:Rad3-related DNA helicase